MTDLIKLEDVNATVLFGSDEEVTAIIQRIDEAARSIVFDINTSKGRKEAASVAAKVARSKTYLDSLGKDLVSGIKDQAKKIDVRRKKIRDVLDGLKEDVRRPLTEFEEKEKERVAAHESVLVELVMSIDAVQSMDTEALSGVSTLIATASDRDFEEYEERAALTLARVRDAVASRQEALRVEAEQKAEIERLQREAAEREQREREERIAREAEEKAKLEAEQKLREEEDRRREEEERRIAAEKEKLEAERRELEAKKQAEEDRLAAERREAEAKERAEEERKAAAERAREEERARIEAEKKAEAEEAAKRKADQEHRAAVNGEILEALLAVAAGLSIGDGEAFAAAIVTEISRGRIPHVSIAY